MNPISRKPQLEALNQKVLLIASLIVLVVMVIGWDIWNRRPRPINCDDGQRYAIDTRQFTTEYWAYSLQLETNVKNESKVQVKLDPVQQAKLTEAIENANEFRKYVVFGYNACAITKDQYAEYGARFQTLDGLARQINVLLGKQTRSDSDNVGLSTLIAQYSDIAHKAAAK